MKNNSQKTITSALGGIVSKRMASPYRSGPSKAWLKTKNPKAPAEIDGKLLLQKGDGPKFIKMKERQSDKIRQLRDGLAAAGFVTLDEQAKALGLCRSTTWTLLKGNHKGSGLSATTIDHILLAPQLPSVVRAKILEYVEEKAAGSYGHSKEQRSRFITRLSASRSLNTDRSCRHAA
jgi:hypothetical protein